MSLAALTAEQRHFCRLVGEASVANHFGDIRLGVDRQISPGASSPTRHDLFHEVQARVQSFVDDLERVGKADCTRFSGGDRRLIELTLLFDLFHRLMKDFDKHILEQEASPDAPLPLRFVGPAFDDLF